MNEKITWRPSTEWTYDDYSLNIRLYLLAGKQPVADAMTAQCRAKFNREPDLTPQPADDIYFRDTFASVRHAKGVRL